MPIRSLHLSVLIFAPLIFAVLFGGYPVTHPIALSLRNASYVSLVFFAASLFIPSFRNSLKQVFSGTGDYTALEREEGRIAACIAVFFAVVFFKATLLDYLTFHANAVDLSMYDYALMNTLEGRFFQPVDAPYNHFGVHFTPTLLLLLPLYAVFKTPLLSLFLHPLVLWMGGVTLFRKILKPTVPSALARLGILFAYFNSIWVGLVLHFHFHVEVFYIPLTFLLVAAIRDRGWKLAVLYSVLYLGIKEDAPFYWVGILIASSIMGWLPKKWAALGSATGVGYAAFVLKIAIPSFRQGDYQLVPAATGYGTDVTSVISNLWSSLPIYLKGLTQGGWIKATYQWLFLPWIDPFFAIASIPYIAIHNLAFGGSMRAMHMHYSSPFIPLLYIGVAHSFTRLWTWRPKKRKQILTLFGVGFLMSSFLGGGYLVFRKYESGWRTLARIDGSIPLEARICVQPDALPHLRYRGDRIKFFDLGCVSDRVENLIFQERFASFNANPEQTAEWIRQVQASQAYELVLNDRGWYWFKSKK